ncbi:surface protease GP63, partial [Trypanosoma conorhini]
MRQNSFLFLLECHEERRTAQWVKLFLPSSSFLNCSITIPLSSQPLCLSTARLDVFERKRKTEDTRAKSLCGSPSALISQANRRIHFLMRFSFLRGNPVCQRSTFMVGFCLQFVCVGLFCWFSTSLLSGSTALCALVTRARTVPDGNNKSPVMLRLLCCALLLQLCTGGLVAAVPHRCVFDHLPRVVRGVAREVAPAQPPVSVSVGSDWVPIRIRVFADSLEAPGGFCSRAGERIEMFLGGQMECQEEDILTEEKVEILKNVILPEAARMH